MIVFFVEFAAEVQQAVLFNGLTDAAHQVQQEIKVVVGQQPGGKDFVLLAQMAQVGLGIVGAGVAGAVGVQGVKSSSCFLFLMTTFPTVVRAVPLRAMRVGRTQSNMSTPLSTPSIRQSGVPTPMRYRGLSAGSRGVV